MPVLLAGSAVLRDGNYAGDIALKNDAALSASSSPTAAGAGAAVLCWCTPKVKTVIIVPSAFAVMPGSIFELRARLYDADGIEIPEFYGYSPHWTITDKANVDVLRREGHSIVLEVPNNIDVSTFEVTAEADVSPSAVSSPATVQVISTAPTGVDYIFADPRTNSKSLSVALAASPSWDVTPVAFSGFGVLGNLTKPGGVMVFSPDHAMAYHNAGWTASPEPFDYRSVGVNSPKLPLKKDITIWIDPAAGEDQWSATTAAAMARLHVADANRTFLRNRTGVEFHLSAIRYLTTEAPNSTCVAWGGAVKGVPVTGGAETVFDDSKNTNAIDVFVIDMGYQTGRACAETDAAPGYRIFLNGALTVPRVLGHELGHVLLNTDSQDHVDAESIGQSNLMIDSCNYTCEIAPQKTHVSLGQACKMNMSKVVAALRPAALATPTECPSIRKDVP